MYNAQTASEEFLQTMFITIEVSPGTSIDKDLTEASFNSAAFPNYNFNFSLSANGRELQFWVDNGLAPEIPVDDLSPMTQVFTVYWNGPASSPPCSEYIQFSTTLNADNFILTKNSMFCNPGGLNNINNVCFDAAQISLSGQIHQKHNLLSVLGLYNMCSVNNGARNVEVNYYDDTGTPLCSDVTGNDGIHSCDNLKPCTITVKPEKEDHDDCGLSYEDINRIRDHYLGINPFAQKWQYFAADVNRDRFIDVVDLLSILNVINHWGRPFNFDPWIFVYEDLYKNFIPSFANFLPNNSESYTNPFTASKNDIDFYMIKGGDVVLENLAEPSAPPLDIPSCDLCVATSIVRFGAVKEPEPDVDVSKIKYTAPKLDEGFHPIGFRVESHDKDRVTYTLHNDNAAFGGSMALYIDPEQWEFVQDIPVHPTDRMPDWHGVFDPVTGIWKYTWITGIQEGYRGDLIRLVLRKRHANTGDFEGMHLSPTAPFNYVYTGDKLLALVLNKEQMEASTQAPRFIASPNPFRDKLNLICLQQLDLTPCEIAVFTLSGSQVATQTFVPEKGTSYIPLDLNGIQQRGVLLVRISQGSNIQYLKLLRN